MSSVTTHSQIFYSGCLVLMAIFGAASHLCLKRGAEISAHRRFPCFIFEPWIFAGLFLAALAVLLQIFLLRYLPLVLVIPAGSLIYMLVPMGACLLLKERLRRRFWVGAVLLVAGVTIIGLSLRS